jgi:SAM-dependent methyltransferase
LEARERRVIPSGNHDGSDAAWLTDDVTETGVFQAVLDGYDAVYDALPKSLTFTRLWQTLACRGDFPEAFAHIGFLMVPEALRLRELLQIGSDDVVVDLACGAGGPGLWMASQSGASLIGVDPSAVGLAAARARARDVGLADRAHFHFGTFEQTNLPDGVADAVMSVEALQYAPDKKAALAEFLRVLRPGGRLAFIAFEVDPAKVTGLPVLGADPVPDFVPLLEAAGFRIEAYEETPGWQERVNETFRAIVDAQGTLVAEMGEHAAASAVAEAMLTIQLQPYPRRILAAASRIQ